MKWTYTEVSGNRKTGKIFVSKTSSDSCPPSCGMFFECYGKFHHLKGHWDRLDRGEGNTVVDWSAYLAAVRKYAEGIWRHGEVGDLPGKGNKIDTTKLAQLAKANKGKKGFAYTHKPVEAGNYRVQGKPEQVKKGKVSESLAQKNRDAIKAANDAGFTVNLSCDSLAEVDRKVALDIGPVVTVLPMDAEDGVKYATPSGIPIVTCPAARADLKEKEITCKTCKLCAIPGRKSVVGFPAHGAAKKRASLKVLNG
jgi:hypothetical protein